MIGRRAATAAGRTLNEVAEDCKRLVQLGQVTPTRYAQTESAVRCANAVIFQYYLIPRKIRERYFREELTEDGV